jgi:hypothetical protein
MRPRNLMTVLLVAALTASGCLGGGKAAPKVADPTHGGLEGRVIDDESFPVFGANLSFVGLVGLKTVTGPNGTFQFDAVPAGQQNLLVDAPGYPPYVQRIKIEAGNVTRNVTLRLQTISEPPPTPYVSDLVPIQGLIYCGVGLATTHTLCTGTTFGSVYTGRFPVLKGNTAVAWQLEWDDAGAGKARVLNLSWNSGSNFNRDCQAHGATGLMRICQYASSKDYNIWFDRETNVTWTVKPQIGQATNAYQDGSGVILQQHFTLYVSLFYWNHPVPEGFSPKAGFQGDKP